MILGKLSSAYRTACDRGIIILTQASWRLMVAAAQRLGGQRYINRRIHSYRMLLDTKDPGLSRSLLLFRTRELDHKVMLERIVRPGMTIFDIGGNIGYYPLMELSLLGGTGKLVVIEPSPSNVDLLRRNLMLNNYDNVPVLRAAVSDISGKRAFYLSEQSNLGTFHPVGSGAQTLTGEVIDVDTVTVPMLADRYGLPGLIRMDVEGHEVEILNGLLADVERGRYAPTIIFETHLTRYDSGHDMAQTLRRMFELGYAVPLASSSSSQGTLRLISLGYAPGTAIVTDGVVRTLFENIGREDAIRIITETGGLRTVVLEMQK